MVPATRALFITAFACMALAAAGCGSSSTSSSTSTTPQVKAHPKPKPRRYTAYDLSERQQVEHQILATMHRIAKRNPGHEVTKRSHCVADTSRTFTCSSDITLSYTTAGVSDSYCARVSSTQRGTVNPDGSFDWATTTSNSNQTVCP